MNSPEILIVRLLEACDAGCFMCSFANSEDGYRFTAADAAQLADDLRGSSFRLVRLTGGEPLLVADLPQILNCLSDADLLTSLITNGSQLARRADELREAGLSQVIVSLDAPTARKHDRFRRTLGLYDQAISGIRSVREQAPEILVRVNTVVSPANVADLCDMYDLLAREGVSQWSLIPLKWNDRSVRYNDSGGFRALYRAFQQHVDRAPGPRLLGYGRSWAGRTDAEVSTFIATGRPFTPGPRCQLVERVRYLTPKDGRVFPCNCVPHRMEGSDLSWPAGPSLLNDERGADVVSWLALHGPDACAGCEPVNVGLGDGSTDLSQDIFGY